MVLGLGDVAGGGEGRGVGGGGGDGNCSSGMDGSRKIMRCDIQCVEVFFTLADFDLIVGGAFEQRRAEKKRGGGGVKGFSRGLGRNIKIHSSGVRWKIWSKLIFLQDCV